MLSVRTYSSTIWEELLSSRAADFLRSLRTSWLELRPLQRTPMQTWLSRRWAKRVRICAGLRNLRRKVASAASNSCRLMWAPLHRKSPHHAPPPPRRGYRSTRPHVGGQQGRGSQPDITAPVAGNPDHVRSELPPGIHIRQRTCHQLVDHSPLGLQGDDPPAIFGRRQAAQHLTHSTASG